MTAKELRRRGTCVRPGCKVMKLDRSKTEGKVRFPWQRSKKAQREEAKRQYAHLTRVGRVSMVQIGEDEFRTPSRRERRAAGIRSRNKAPPAYLAQKKGLSSLARRTIHLEWSEALVAAQMTAARLRSRPYTRKVKLARKAAA